MGRDQSKLAYMNKLKEVVFLTNVRDLHIKCISFTILDKVCILIKILEESHMTFDLGDKINIP